MSNFSKFVRCCVVICVAVLPLGGMASAETELPPTSVWLDELSLDSMTTGFGRPRAKISMDDKPLSLLGAVYPHGIGTHAHSEWKLDLQGVALRFEALVGVDDNGGIDNVGSVGFEVWLDGRLYNKTPVMKRGEKPQLLQVDLTGIKELKLVVNDGGDGIACDHANWANAFIQLLPNVLESKTSEVARTPLIATLREQQFRSNQEHGLRLIVQPGLSRAFSFSPDMKYFVTGGNKARVWEFSSCKVVREFHGHDFGYNRSGNGTRVQDTKFSPDGQFVLSGGEDNMARLWNIRTGKEVRNFAGCSSDVAFSPDGEMIASADNGGILRLWNVATGKEIHRFEGHTSKIGRVLFTSSGKHLISSGTDYTIRKWDVATGKELLRFDSGGWVQSLFCSPDEKYLVSVSQPSSPMYLIPGYTPTNPGAVILWDFDTGEIIKRFEFHNKNSYKGGDLLATVSPNWNYIILPSQEYSGEKAKVVLWDINARAIAKEMTLPVSARGASFFASPRGLLLNQDGQWWDFETKNLVAQVGPRSTSVTPTGRSGIKFMDSNSQLLIGSHLWDLSLGKEIPIAEVNKESDTAYSQDSRFLCIRKLTNDTKNFEIVAVDLLDSLRTTYMQGLQEFLGNNVWTSSLTRNLTFSPDNNYLVAYSPIRSEIGVWDVHKGQKIRSFEEKVELSTGFDTGDRRINCSLDGKYAVAIGKGMAYGWDFLSGKLLWKSQVGELEKIQTLENGTIRLSVDGNYFFYCQRGPIKMCEVSTGKIIRSIGWGNFFNVSPDGKYILTASSDYLVRLWSIGTGQEVRSFQSTAGQLSAIEFSPDGQFIAVQESQIHFWRTETGERLCSLSYFNDRTWAVIDPEGRYDASNGGDVQSLHWVKGLTPIELKQFKDGFYEPGLLAKKLGYNKEPLRNVPLLADLKLFPETTIAPIADGKTATVNLTNQDGGIGAVQVFINDKELLADARPVNFDANQKTATITVNLDSPLAKPGQENKLRIVTRNSEGTLASRPVEATWTAPGTVEKHEPELYAIVGGVSEYADPKAIKSLRFSAKDARDMATALKLGAEKLFNTKRVHLQLLTGESKPKNDVPRIAATKANFKTAFELVAKQAKPDDVVVVYLAGHGTTLGLGSSTYCYLTQDAAGTDFSDEKNRAAWTITSEELAEWTKKIPAQKQMLMLDTCAAGAAADDLTKRRDISGDQIRAMERLKDRVGFHVLMGSASDAVSYEAGRYNQGLLTYALLEGMKGRALREGKFVDVRTLFDYARDRVPQLAKNIGGIQQPQTASPKGDSFDVALVTDSEKQSIPLSIEQPQVLRPIVFDAGTDDNFDTLKFEPLLREALNDVGSHSEQSTVGMVYIDSGGLPGALRPMCSYKIKDDKVQVSVIMQRDGKNEGESLQLEGKKTQLELLSLQVAQSIRTRVARKAGVRLVEEAAPTTEKRAVTPAIEKPVATIEKPATPQVGEIALRGIVKSVDKKANQFVLQVRSFRLPSGKESSIAPKDKTILINAQTIWRGVALNTLKVGANIEAIGPDGSKELKANFLGLLQKSD